MDVNSKRHGPDAVREARHLDDVSTREIVRPLDAEIRDFDAGCHGNRVVTLVDLPFDGDVLVPKVEPARDRAAVVADFAAIGKIAVRQAFAITVLYYASYVVSREKDMGLARRPTVSMMEWDRV